MNLLLLLFYFVVDTNLMTNESSQPHRCDLWAIRDSILHWIDSVLIKLWFKLNANYLTDFKKICQWLKCFRGAEYMKKHASRAITITLLVVSFSWIWFLSVSLFIYFIWFVVVSLTKYPSASKDLKKQKSIDNSWTSFYIFIISFSIVFSSISFRCLHFVTYFILWLCLSIRFFLYCSAHFVPFEIEIDKSFSIHLHVFVTVSWMYRIDVIYNCFKWSFVNVRLHWVCNSSI